MSISRTTDENRMRIPRRLRANTYVDTSHIEQKGLETNSRNHILLSNRDDDTTCVTIGVVCMAILAFLTVILLLLATSLDPNFLMIPIAPN